MIIRPCVLYLVLTPLAACGGLAGSDGSVFAPIAPPASIVEVARGRALAAPARSVAVDRTGTLAAVAEEHTIIEIVDLTRAKVVRAVRLPEGLPIVQLSFSRDGRSVLGHDGRCITQIDLDTGRSDTRAIACGDFPREEIIAV